MVTYAPPSQTEVPRRIYESMGHWAKQCERKVMKIPCLFALTLISALIVPRTKIAQYQASVNSTRGISSFLLSVP